MTTIVIRGCVFRVSKARARELRKLLEAEKATVQREWNQNQLP